MPTRLDLAYVALFAIAWPVADWLRWRRVEPRLRAAPHRERVRLYVEAVVTQWALVALGAAVWVRAGRPWAPLGLHVPLGWRLGVAATLVGGLLALHGRNVWAVARRPRARAQARQLFAPLAFMLPHTGRELAAFLALSVTAGACEEVLFRGYLPWALAPWLTWGGAALAGAAPFGFLHAYQGRAGVVRTALTGAAMAGVVALTGSLLPAIAAHALVDISSGLLAWLVLREAQRPDAAAGDAVHGTPPAVTPERVGPVAHA